MKHYDAQDKYELCLIVDIESSSCARLMYVMGRYTSPQSSSSWKLTKAENIQNYSLIARTYCLFLLYHLLAESKKQGDKKAHPVKWVYILQHNEVNNKNWNLFFKNVHSAIGTHGRQETAAIRTANGLSVDRKQDMTGATYLSGFDYLCITEQARFLKLHPELEMIGILQRSFNGSSYGTNLSANVSAPFGYQDVYLCNWADVYECLKQSYNTATLKEEDLDEGLTSKLPLFLNDLRIDPDNPDNRKTFCSCIAHFMGYPELDADSDLIQILEKLVEERAPERKQPTSDKTKRKHWPQNNTCDPLSVREVVDKVADENKWFEDEWQQSSEIAWDTVNFEQMCKYLTEYYEEHGVHCHCYASTHAGQVRVPLYVPAKWQSFCNSDIDEPSLAPEETTYIPSETQKTFLNYYIGYRNMDPNKNNRIFKLTHLDCSGPRLKMNFAEGRFFDSIMCQYILEHEFVISKARADYGKLRLPLRDKVAGTTDAILKFCEHNVARMGISNLLLFKNTAETYVAEIHSRGQLKLARGLDTVSSGIWDITTGATADIEPRHKVLIEVCEELYGKDSFETESHKTDPYWFYKDPPVRDLIALTKENMATFSITGFCIDLIRMVPELTCVWVVRDQEYYNKHKQHFELSHKEYYASAGLEIPSNIIDVAHYLKEACPSHPDERPRKSGFDPMRWTLPGAFCFHQGIKTAVEKKLL